MHRSRIEFPKLFNQIQVMGNQERAEVQQRRDSLEKALDLLHDRAGSADEIIDRIKMITQRDSGIRCAIPTEERLDVGICLPEDFAQPVTIVAADASQISPEDGEEEDLDFGLINIGLFRWLANGHGTEEICISRLLHHYDLYQGNNWAMDGSMFRLRRDVGERVALIEQIMSEPDLTVGLIDGPLELFREPGSTKDRREISDTFINSLTKLSETGQIIAGYTDHPRANLVVRMLEMMLLGENKLEDARNFQPFGRLRDRALFQNILPPGARSAIFQIQSSTTKYYTGKITPHFFYVNVTAKGSSFQSIARVDIPRSVANNPMMVNTLQAALLTQSRYLGGKPYPYALIRAHEICLITREDAALIMRIVGDTYRRMGVTTIEPSSYKSELKRALG